VLIVANQHRSMSQIIFSTIFAWVISFASLLTPLSGLAMLVVPNASGFVSGKPDSEAGLGRHEI
jgi:hypothetical protein